MSDIFLGDLPLWSDADARAMLEELWMLFKTGAAKPAECMNLAT